MGAGDGDRVPFSAARASVALAARSDQECGNGTPELLHNRHVAAASAGCSCGRPGGGHGGPSCLRTSTQPRAVEGHRLVQRTVGIPDSATPRRWRGQPTAYHGKTVGGSRSRRRIHRLETRRQYSRPHHRIPRPGCIPAHTFDRWRGDLRGGVRTVSCSLAAELARTSRCSGLAEQFCSAPTRPGSSAGGSTPHGSRSDGRMVYHIRKRRDLHTPFPVCAEGCGDKNRHFLFHCGS